MNLIYVDLQKSTSRWPLKRPQKWTWVARNGNNMRILARSSESYTNRNDAIAAIEQLFGVNSNVYLRRDEQGNALLRLAA